MPSPTRLLRAILAFTGLAFASLQAHANFPVYTYAYAGLDLDSDEVIDVSDESLTPFASGASASIGSQGSSQAQAMTDFGHHQAFAQTVNPPGGLEQAGALSMWSDLFHVTGGAGTGSAQVSATITGGFASQYYAAATYALLVSETPLLPDAIFDFVSTFTLPAGASVVMAGFGDSFSGAGPVHEVLTGSFDFAYDTDFFLTSVFVVGASDSGQADFLHSAQFGITVTGDLNPMSGTSYVAAVPEAETWAMLLAGMGLLGLRLRRRLPTLR